MTTRFLSVYRYLGLRRILTRASKNPWLSRLEATRRPVHNCDILLKSETEMGVVSMTEVTDQQLAFALRLESGRNRSAARVMAPAHANPSVRCITYIA